jgi:Tol biopolymer transport system component
LNGFDAPGNNTSSAYQACSSGSYQVLVTNSNGCAKISNVVQVTINNCKEESDLTSQSMLLYPNPSSAEVTVSFYVDKDGSNQLFLLDLTGRVVQQLQLQSVAGHNETKINIASIPPGLYYVYLKTDPIQVAKLIRQ